MAYNVSSNVSKKWREKEKKGQEVQQKLASSGKQTTYTKTSQPSYTPQPSYRRQSDNTFKPIQYNYDSTPANQWTAPQYAAYGRNVGDSSVFEQLSSETDIRGSQFWNPYRAQRSTLPSAVGEFFKKNYGYEGPFDQKFLDDFAFLANNVQYTNTNAIKTPTKKSSVEEWGGYWHNLVAKNMQENADTNNQFGEYRAALAQYATDFEKLHGRKPSLEEFTNGVDRSKYSKLSAIDDTFNNFEKTVQILPTGTNYSPDIIPGIYQAWMNGDDITNDRDYFEDAVNYYLSPVQASPSVKKYTWSDADLTGMSPDDKQKYYRQLRSSGSFEEAAAFDYASWSSERQANGVEVSPTILQQTIGYYKDDNWFNEAHDRLGVEYDNRLEYDGTMKNPGTKGSDMDKACWELYQAEKTRTATDEVEAEFNSLKDQIVDTFKKVANDYAADEFEIFKEDCLAGLDIKNNKILQDYFKHGNDSDYYCRQMPISNEAIDVIIKRVWDGKDVSKNVDYTAIDDDEFEAPFMHRATVAEPLFYKEDQRQQAQARISSRNNAEKQAVDAVVSLSESGIPVSKGQLPVTSESFDNIYPTPTPTPTPSPSRSIEPAPTPTPEPTPTSTVEGVLGKIWYDSRSEAYQEKLGPDYTPKQAAVIDPVLNQTGTDNMPDEITVGDITRLLDANAMANAKDEDITLATGIIGHTIPGAKYLHDVMLDKVDLTSDIRTAMKFNVAAYKSVYDDRIDAGLSEEDAAEIAYFAATDLNAASESISTLYEGDKDLEAASNRLVADIAAEDGAKDSYEIIKALNDDVNGYISDNDLPGDTNLTDLNAALMIGASESADPAFRAQTNNILHGISDGSITPEDIVEGISGGVTNLPSGATVSDEEYEAVVNDARSILDASDYLFGAGTEFDDMPDSVRDAIKDDDIIAFADELSQEPGFEGSRETILYEARKAALDALVNKDKAYNTNDEMEGFGSDFLGDLEELSSGTSQGMAAANSNDRQRSAIQSIREDDRYNILPALMAIRGDSESEMGDLVDFFSSYGKYFSANEVNAAMNAFVDGTASLNDIVKLGNERIATVDPGYVNALNNPEGVSRMVSGLREKLGNPISSQIAALADPSQYMASNPELFADVDRDALQRASIERESGIITDQEYEDRIVELLGDKGGFTGEQSEMAGKLIDYVEQLGPSAIDLFNMDNDLIKQLTGGTVDLDAAGFKDMGAVDVLDRIDPNWTKVFNTNPGAGFGYTAIAGLGHGAIRVLSIPAKADNFLSAALGYNGLLSDSYRALQNVEGDVESYESNVATSGERFFRQAFSEFSRNIITSAMGGKLASVFVNSATKFLASGGSLAEKLASLSSTQLAVERIAKGIGRIPSTISVFFNTADEELRKGSSTTKAAAKGALSSAIEIFTENPVIEKTLSFRAGGKELVEHLYNTMESIGDIGIYWGAKTAENIVTEIAQEELSEIFDRVVDFGDYLSSGESLHDAFTKSTEGLGADLLATAGSTAVTTLLYGALDLGGMTYTIMNDMVQDRRNHTSEEIVRAMVVDLLANMDEDQSPADTAEDVSTQSMMDEKKAMRAAEYNPATQVPSFGGENVSVEENNQSQASESVSNAVETATSEASTPEQVEEVGSEETQKNADVARGIDVNSWADLDLAISEEAYNDMEESFVAEVDRERQENADVAQANEPTPPSPDQNAVNTTGVAESKERKAGLSKFSQKHPTKNSRKLLADYANSLSDVTALDGIRELPSDPVSVADQQLEQAAFEAAKNPSEETKKAFADAAANANTAREEQKAMRAQQKAQEEAEAQQAGEVTPEKTFTTQGAKDVAEYLAASKPAVDNAIASKGGDIAAEEAVANDAGLKSKQDAIEKATQAIAGMEQKIQELGNQSSYIVEQMRQMFRAAADEGIDPTVPSPQTTNAQFSKQQEKAGVDAEAADLQEKVETQRQGIAADQDVLDRETERIRNEAKSKAESDLRKKQEDFKAQAVAIAEEEEKSLNRERAEARGDRVNFDYTNEQYAEAAKRNKAQNETAQWLASQGWVSSDYLTDPKHFDSMPVEQRREDEWKEDAINNRDEEQEDYERRLLGDYRAGIASQRDESENTIPVSKDLYYRVINAMQKRAGMVDTSQAFTKRDNAGIAQVTESSEYNDAIQTKDSAVYDASMILNDDGSVTGGAASILYDAVTDPEAKSKTNPGDSFEHVTENNRYLVLRPVQAEQSSSDSRQRYRYLTDVQTEDGLTGIERLERKADSAENMYGIALSKLNDAMFELAKANNWYDLGVQKGEQATQRSAAKAVLQAQKTVEKTKRSLAGYERDYQKAVSDLDSANKFLNDYSEQSTKSKPKYYVFDKSKITEATNLDAIAIKALAQASEAFAEYSNLSDEGFSTLLVDAGYSQSAINRVDSAELPMMYMDYLYDQAVARISKEAYSGAVRAISGKDSDNLLDAFVKENGGYAEDGIGGKGFASFSSREHYNPNNVFYITEEAAHKYLAPEEARSIGIKRTAAQYNAAVNGDIDAYAKENNLSDEDIRFLRKQLTIEQQSTNKKAFYRPVSDATHDLGIREADKNNSDTNTWIRDNNGNYDIGLAKSRLHSKMLYIADHINDDGFKLPNHSIRINYVDGYGNSVSRMFGEMYSDGEETSRWFPSYKWVIDNATEVTCNFFCSSEYGNADSKVNYKLYPVSHKSTLPDYNEQYEENAWMRTEAELQGEIDKFEGWAKTFDGADEATKAAFYNAYYKAKYNLAINQYSKYVKLAANADSIDKVKLYSGEAEAAKYEMEFWSGKHATNHSTSGFTATPSWSSMLQTAKDRLTELTSGDPRYDDASYQAERASIEAMLPYLEKAADKESSQQESQPQTPVANTASESTIPDMLENVDPLTKLSVLKTLQDMGENVDTARSEVIAAFHEEQTKGMTNEQKLDYYAGIARYAKTHPDSYQIDPNVDYEAQLNTMIDDQLKLEQGKLGRRLKAIQKKAGSYVKLSAMNKIMSELDDIEKAGFDVGETRNAMQRNIDAVNGTINPVKEAIKETAIEEVGGNDEAMKMNLRLFSADTNEQEASGIMDEMDQWVEGTDFYIDTYGEDGPAGAMYPISERASKVLDPNNVLGIRADTNEQEASTPVQETEQAEPSMEQMMDEAASEAADAMYSGMQEEAEPMPLETGFESLVEAVGDNTPARVSGMALNDIAETLAWQEDRIRDLRKERDSLTASIDNLKKQRNAQKKVQDDLQPMAASFTDEQRQTYNNAAAAMRQIDRKIDQRIEERQAVKNRIKELDKGREYLGAALGNNQTAQLILNNKAALSPELLAGKNNKGEFKIDRQALKSKAKKFVELVTKNNPYGRNNAYTAKQLYNAFSQVYDTEELNRDARIAIAVNNGLKARKQAIAQLTLGKSLLDLKRNLIDQETFNQLRRDTINSMLAQMKNFTEADIAERRQSREHATRLVDGFIAHIESDMLSGSNINSIYDLLDHQMLTLQANIDQTEKFVSDYFRVGSNDIMGAFTGQNGGRIPISMIKLGTGMILNALDRNKGKAFHPVSLTFDNIQREIGNFIGGNEGAVFTAMFIDPLFKTNGQIARAKTNMLKNLPKFKSEETRHLITEMLDKGYRSEDSLREAHPELSHDQCTELLDAAEKYRSAFDSLNAQQNVVYARNGLNPVLRRNDYVPYIKQEESTWLRKLGINTNPDQLSAGLLGDTANTTPAHKYSPFEQERTSETMEGMETDIEKIMDQYLDYVLPAIYQTDHIIRLNDMIDALGGFTDKQGQYVRGQLDFNDSGELSKNNLGVFVKALKVYRDMMAGKKVGFLDRAAETTVGRKFFGYMQAATNMQGAAKVGGNMRPVMLNTVPLTTTFAMFPRDTAIAIAQTLNKNSSDIKDESFFAASRLADKRKGDGPVAKINNALFKPMELSDAFVTEIVWRAAYNNAFRKLGDDEQARLQADKFALSVMADKSKGNKGKLYASAVGGTLGQFTQEATNEISFLARDLLPYLGIDSKSGNTAGLHGVVKALTATLLMMLGYRGINEVVGGNAAIDPIGSYVRAKGEMKEDDDFWNFMKYFTDHMAETINPVENITSGNLLNAPMPSAIKNTLNNSFAGFTGLYNTLFNNDPETEDDYSWAENFVDVLLEWTPGGTEMKRIKNTVKAGARGYDQSSSGNIKFGFGGRSVSDDEAKAINESSLIPGLNMGNKLREGPAGTVYDYFNSALFGTGASRGGRLYNYGKIHQLDKTMTKKAKEYIEAGMNPSDAIIAQRTGETIKETTQAAKDADRWGDNSRALRDQAKQARYDADLPADLSTNAAENYDQTWMKKGLDLWKETGKITYPTGLNIVKKGEKNGEEVFYLQSDGRNIPLTEEQKETMERRYNQQAKIILMNYFDADEIEKRLKALPNELKKSFIKGGE
jgi:hypothetical protein